MAVVRTDPGAARLGRMPVAARIVRVAFGVSVLALPAVAAGQSFTVVDRESAVVIHVGKAGLFGFAGHEHEVVAPVAEGRIVADTAALERSSVTLAFETTAFRVTGKGEPAQDVPKVQEAMAGPKVLDVTRFPGIRFTSNLVSGRLLDGGAYELRVTGELALHGVTRTLTLPVRVEVAGETLTARGRTALKQSDFGMRPLSVGGVVKVKDELALEFHIVARVQNRSQTKATEARRPSFRRGEGPRGSAGRAPSARERSRRRCRPGGRRGRPGARDGGRRSRRDPPRTPRAGAAG